MPTIEESQSGAYRGQHGRVPWVGLQQKSGGVKSYDVRWDRCRLHSDHDDCIDQVSHKLGEPHLCAG